MAINHPPVWRIKVVLVGTRPMVWRRFDTYSTVTLFQLHYHIQGVMGWELAHLFSFQAEHGLELNDSSILANVCRIGDTLGYVYDFGDNWEHLVTIEKEMRVRPGIIYPRCVAGKNACPPEDCGGTWGYADMLRILAGRRNARRRELVEWLGGSFDPKLFELDEANERLAEYAEVAS
ncbi:plasmid pRiA4b ORF-3 family protein [Methylobacter sp.]|uniref:plasmid pRiA4b ORF-3 family protein n=1 Tax=Methylobacter sp. TaxID=2051955 RepID=UPI003DA6034E